MRSPCIDCKKWKTITFPKCRNKCESIDKYLATFNLKPAMGDYVNLTHSIVYNRSKIFSGV